MSDLEQKLVAIAADLDLPAAPDRLALRVVDRLAAKAPRRVSPRRLVVVALAVLAVALGAAFAVPQARTAILEWFGLRGVRIERTPTRPQEPAGPGLSLGELVTLEEARERAAFGLVLPRSLPGPSQVYFSDALPGGQVVFAYWRTDPVRPLILFAQFRARLDEVLIQKSAGPGTVVEPVVVHDEPGYWLTGEAHLFGYIGPDGEARVESLRLAGDVLVWERDGLTLRLEGVASKSEALRIAASVR